MRWKVFIFQEFAAGDILERNTQHFKSSRSFTMNCRRRGKENNCKKISKVGAPWGTGPRHLYGKDASRMSQTKLEFI